MGKRDLTMVMFGIGFLLLSACTHAMKAYPGPELPSAQTALVQSGAYTQILSLDGLPVTSRKVSILPGSHSVVIRILDEESTPISVAYAFYSLSDGTVDFVAKPGHQYVASVDVIASPFPISGENDTGFRWVGYVRDRINNQIIAQTDYLPVGVWPRIRGSLAAP